MNNMDATTDIVRLREMVNAALELQTALIGHDSDAIWQALNKIESVVQLIQSNCRSRAQGNSAALQAGVIPKEQQEAVQGLVAKIKRIQRTNRMIAGSFLKIINRTLSFISAGNLSGAGNYDSAGGFNLKSGAVLIEQKG